MDHMRISGNESLSVILRQKVKLDMCVGNMDAPGRNIVKIWQNL